MSVKTVSLETAKLLKEAGFKKDCHFGFIDDEYECNPSPMEWPIYAPTSDELLEELPYNINLKGWNKYFSISKTDVQYYVSYMGGGSDNLCESNKSLPEALAQMWLYLRKEGLIEVKI
jgi:hypothetical protein